MCGSLCGRSSRWGRGTGTCFGWAVRSARGPRLRAERAVACGAFDGLRRGPPDRCRVHLPPRPQQPQDVNTFHASCRAVQSGDGANDNQGVMGHGALYARVTADATTIHLITPDPARSPRATAGRRTWSRGSRARCAGRRGSRCGWRCGRPTRSRWRASPRLSRPDAARRSAVVAEPSRQPAASQSSPHTSATIHRSRTVPLRLR